jgi:transposase
MGFFTSLPPGVCDGIEIVTMDMSQAYQKAVRETLSNAQIAFDHFHVAKLANEALKEVRRQLACEMYKIDPEEAKAIKGMRWPTAYTFENLPKKHAARLQLLQPDSSLGRAYLLKEQLLDVLKLGPAYVADGLRIWRAWACRSRFAPFVRLGRTIKKHTDGILAFVENQISNTRAEGINNKIRLLSHRAYGFHSAPPLIATVYLCCGGVHLPDKLRLL